MDITIIGAGVAGLSAAYDLTRGGHRVTLYEAASTPGGLASGFRAEGWDWALETFYHHWFSNDYDIIELIEAIGTRDKLIFKQPTTSYWHPQGTFALDKPTHPNPIVARALNVLGIPYLNLLAKLRLGAVSFLLTKIPDGTFLEKHTAEGWARRWMGPAAHELIWRPLLISKFGALYEQVNMAWLWARLYKRTAELGTYEGGFQAFADDLAAHVEGLGAHIHYDAPVNAISAVEGGYWVQAADREPQPADVVLSTASPRLTNRLMGDLLPAAYRRKLSHLKSIGAMICIVALDRQLMEDGTYWLNLPAESTDKRANHFPYLALVEHTNYMDKAHYGGDHLVYLGDYLPPEHPHYALSDEEIYELYIGSLKKVRPDFDRVWVKRWWVFRAPYTQPVPTINHSQNIPAISTGVQGLYMANMSQVYPWDRGTNYAVEIGRRAARLIMDEA
jgi:protoporphyrinogen oxidase